MKIIKENVLYVLIFTISTCIIFFKIYRHEKNTNSTIASINRRLIDLGSMQIDENAKAVFEVVNVGHNKLTIKNILPGCNCTIPKWSDNPVLPGDTSFIKVFYRNSKLNN